MYNAYGLWAPHDWFAQADIQANYIHVRYKRYKKAKNQRLVRCLENENENENYSSHGAALTAENSNVQKNQETWY